MIYHIFNYLLTYCSRNYETSEDIKDLLNEVRNIYYFSYKFFIMYFTSMKMKIKFKGYTLNWICCII